MRMMQHAVVRSEFRVMSDNLEFSSQRMLRVHALGERLKVICFGTDG
jgi:hypothetical protein